MSPLSHERARKVQKGVKRLEDIFVCVCDNNKENRMTISHTTSVSGYGLGSPRPINMAVAVLEGGRVPLPFLEDQEHRHRGRKVGHGT